MPLEMNKKESSTDKSNRYKIVLLGDSGVGKSSLALRLVKGQYNDKICATIGASFVTSTIHLDDGTVNLDIWDTAGQERFKSLTPMYYRHADAALVVFSIADKESFRGAERWYTELQGHNDSPCVVGLAGNKADLGSARVVDPDDAQHLADTHGLIFLETSAKSGMNVIEIFTEMAKEMKDKRAAKEISSKNISLEDGPTKKRNVADIIFIALFYFIVLRT